MSIRRTLAALAAAASLLTACSGAPAGAPAQPAFSNTAAVAPASAPAARTPGFPADFMWGFATAGYQVEGGEGTSQWHAWEAAGHTQHRSGRAVDFRTRWPQDLDMARGLGANGFRVSVEWSRIEPQRGQFDPAAIQFYRDLIAGIRARGMEPVVTLLHFTFPQWLTEDPDGNGLRDWEDPETIKLYTRYVERMGQELGPLVRYWITFNEPNIWVPGAYLIGATPPGRKSLLSAGRAMWNVLQGHAQAYDVLHRVDPDARVSSNVYQILFRPFIDSADATKTAAVYETDWFMDALERGKAPVSPEAAFGAARPESFVSLLRKFDYVAFDYYYPTRNVQDVLNTTKFWLQPLYPQGFYEVTMKYHRKFGKPILVAENGMATENLAPRPDGWKREDHLVQMLGQLRRAIGEGANVVGYYYWSLLDNYEWGSYDPRFGMYSVDALGDPALTRVPTAAAEAYRRVMVEGITPELLKQYPGPKR